MFTLSSEVNGMAITIEAANVAQLEQMLMGHLSLQALSLTSDGADEFPLMSLRVDMKVTTRTEGDPSSFDETRAPYYGLPHIDTSIAESYVLALIGNGRNLTTVILSVPDALPDASTIYVMLTRNPSDGDWAVHEHLILESGQAESSVTPDVGRFTELTLVDQLRHFATS